MVALPQQAQARSYTMLNFVTRSELINELRTTLAPTAQDPLPPEFQIMAAAILALPGSKDSLYALLDLEVLQAPDWLQALPTTPLSQWQGNEQPGMLGYGGIELLQISRSYGAGGLNIWLGGSPMNSACTIYVVPQALNSLLEVTEV
jgi:hypothetical protein